MEHVSDAVLSKIGKPSVNVYNRFVEEFEKVNVQLGMDQYVVPYLISSHPGSRLKDAILLAEYLNKHKLSPKQVQDFYPTPGTVSTCMYYTGYDPLTMNEVYVANDPHEKAMQRALIQYRDPKNHALVREALRKAHRFDLIGYEPKCLVPPERGKGGQSARSLTSDGNTRQPGTPRAGKGVKTGSPTHSKKQRYKK